MQWIPAFDGKRMEDWLRNMGDWNISRKRYLGLSLPFYVCECGRAERRRLARGAERARDRRVDALPELHRPWIDEVAISVRRSAGRGRGAIPEVGRRLARRRHRPVLDAGLRRARSPSRAGTRRALSRGLSGADLPNHEYWEEWFPADSDLRDARADPALVLLDVFMSVTLEERAPYKQVLAYEKVHDETGRQMHK